MLSNADSLTLERKPPLVSVIIPCFNVAPFISETIESVITQTFNDYEIIVVNDGSPDATELQHALAPYRENITYLEQENRGVSAARNLGIRASRGEFLAFLDGDDVWLPDFLKHQLEFIRSNSGYDLVYSDAYHFGNNCQGLTYMQTCPSEGEVNCESLVSGKCNVICSGVLVRKEVVLEVGLFDEELRAAEDFDLWLRVSKRKGARLNYQRKILVGYRHRDGSLASNTERQVESAVSVYEKTGKRNDLSSRERAALSRTLAAQRAMLATYQAKRELLDGNLAEAIASFETANRLSSTRKLRLIIKSIRVAPRFVQFVVKLAKGRTR